jgi:hypothetical protein
MVAFSVHFNIFTKRYKNIIVVYIFPTSFIFSNIIADCTLRVAAERSYCFIFSACQCKCQNLTRRLLLYVTPDFAPRDSLHTTIYKR